MSSAGMKADGGAHCRSFAFVFPMASGHINPSLPIARSLVRLGHRVHYLCREQMREAIEDTGASFHSDVEHEPELYEGREPNLLGAMDDLKKEHGMEDASVIVAMCHLQEIMLEMALPGIIRWLRLVRADVVVYCPLMNLEAAVAGRVLDIPAIALLTTAGPGSAVTFFQEMLRAEGLEPEDLLEMRRSYKPLGDCIERLRAKYGAALSIDGPLQPAGRLHALLESSLVLVTTCEDMQDPMTPELARLYRDAGVRFEAVGPLLDAQGARRAAGHRYHAEEERERGERQSAEGQPDPVALVKEARGSGRTVVLVSMGTVITGDSPDFGWGARPLGVDGRPCGLTGAELCRSAWGGAFDAFGAESAEEGPLLVVALGPQPDPLGELAPPPNAVCMPVVPQVDVLKAGVDLFLTHGGQNSFTEALSVGAPVVVCPGFGDQVVNAQKAADLGVGLQVARPTPAEGLEAEAAAAYRAKVRDTLREALAARRFREASAGCAERLRAAGGVPRAVALVQAACAIPGGPGAEGGGAGPVAHIAGA